MHPLSFESILEKDFKKEINKSEYKLVSKERPHISKSKLDEFSNAIYIKTNEIKNMEYSDELSTRYIAATNLSYDFLMSIYDVNTRNLAIYRFFKFPESLDVVFAKYFKSLKGARHNLEARIIGLNNNQDYYIVAEELIDFFSKYKIRLVEADLFGNEKRHIAIDSKLGMSFNILMEDRLYRPGELTNEITVENFEASLRKETSLEDIDNIAKEKLKD